MSFMSVNKRLKERNRVDKQREKAAKRQERDRMKAERPPADPGEDPDIAGIVPGPQPIPEEK
jgi:hypothetical protein